MFDNINVYNLKRQYEQIITVVIFVTLFFPNEKLGLYFSTVSVTDVDLFRIVHVFLHGLNFFLSSWVACCPLRWPKGVRSCILPDLLLCRGYVQLFTKSL